MPSILYAPLTRVFITQKFGLNPSMYKKYGLKGHNGIDFRTKFPTTPLGHCHVRALAPGVVSEVGNQGRNGYGIFVRVNHDDGSQSVYGHLYKTFVKVGDRITRPSLTEGTIMALTDNTGASTGSHLHAGYRPPNWQKLTGNGFAGYVDFINQMKV